jgi:glutamyl-Q tRNA(Asp) synthetase
MISDLTQAASGDTASYVGRFAPSPSGPLHRGSLAAAMASYLDAKAHDGRWLLRIEDIDQSRSRRDASRQIIADLSQLGFQFEPGPWYQSQRVAHYEAAFEKLKAMGRIYACVCSRKEIADSHGPNASVPSLGHTLTPPSVGNTKIYPGICRLIFNEGLVPPKHAIRAWRLKLDPAMVEWQEGRWLHHFPADDPAHSIVSHSRHLEHITHQVGDFVIARPVSVGDDSKREWTYQLSVVVDDEEAGVTHIVRGMDLLESTGRQIYLQSLLGYRRLQYWHCPLVLEPNGQKLSKQNGAPAINSDRAVETLIQALVDTGMPNVDTSRLAKLTTAQFWNRAVNLWREKMLATT